MSATIIIYPRSYESAGELVRRFEAMGYSLSNCRGRIVARPNVPVLTNVVRMPKRKLRCEQVFEWLLPEHVK